jgi:hypothetical protein
MEEVPKLARHFRLKLVGCVYAAASPPTALAKKTSSCMENMRALSFGVLPCTCPSLPVRLLLLLNPWIHHPCRLSWFPTDLALNLSGRGWTCQNRCFNAISLTHWYREKLQEIFSPSQITANGRVKLTFDFCQEQEWLGLNG